MSDATLPPRRMRYSLESRCRAVQAMAEGERPEEAAARVGASRATGYRWRRATRRTAGRGCGTRACTPHLQPRRLAAEAEAEILAVRERTGGG